MSDMLLDRLDKAVGRLLERNHQLVQECRQLKQGQVAWQQEKQELLGEIEQVLQKLDALNLEDA